MEVSVKRVVVYAFDVDETLDISNGPVRLEELLALRGMGHVVGLCGNWGLFCQMVPEWQRYVSFLNCLPPFFVAGMQGMAVRVDKAWFLNHLQQYVKADDYVLVGNVKGEKNSLGFVCGSEDSEAAKLSGWRFIKEDDFAKGAR
jgi:hypothetical protein